MKRSVLLIFLSLFSILSGCKDPSAVVKPDADAFLKESPKNFIDEKSSRRPIHAAWAGDPNKRPLLFIHGSPGGWKGWAAFLRNKTLTSNYHVLAVDRPGYGGSGQGHVERSLENQAADIEMILKENKSGLPAILVGHSLGAPVAARLAMDFPKQVAGLILVAGSVSPDLERTKWYQIPANWSLLRWMIPTDLVVCNQEILALKTELEKMRDRWSELKIPVAVVHGEDDDLVPVENVDFLKEHLRAGNLKLVNIIKEMNHFIPWRKPEAILDAIKEIDKSVW